MVVKVVIKRLSYNRLEESIERNRIGVKRDKTSLSKENYVFKSCFTYHCKDFFLKISKYFRRWILVSNIVDSLIFSPRIQLWHYSMKLQKDTRLIYFSLKAFRML